MTILIFLGTPCLFPPSSPTPSVDQLGQGGNHATSDAPQAGSTVTYRGVCLTIWSYADAERSAAIGAHPSGGPFSQRVSTEPHRCMPQGCPRGYTTLRFKHVAKRS